MAAIREKQMIFCLFTSARAILRDNFITLVNVGIIRLLIVAIFTLAGNGSERSNVIRFANTRVFSVKIFSATI